MKVNELRAALADRGLDTKGLKQVLVQRLFEAIEEDPEEGNAEDSLVEKEEAENMDDGESNEEASVEKEDENMADEEVERQAAKEREDEAERIEAEKKALESSKAAELKALEIKQEAERISQLQKEAENKAVEAKKEAERIAAEKREAERKALESRREAEIKALEVKREAERIASEKRKAEENITAQQKMDEGEPEIPENQVDDDEMKIETSKEESKGVFKYTKVVRTVYVRQKEELNEQTEQNEELIDRGKKRKMDDDDEEEDEGERVKRQKVETPVNEGESPSNSKDLDFEVKELEPEIDESLLCLDWYNSDLNLNIGEDKISAQPEHKKGWGYAYAGARATYGFNSGKVWYEVKFTEALDCSLEKEGNRHDLRVGWSTDDSSLQLGEDEFSWCYAGVSGKVANNRTFEEYGEKVGQGDVVGAFVDFEGDAIKMTFTKNGNTQGEAYQILKSEMGGRSLF